MRKLWRLDDSSVFYLIFASNRISSQKFKNGAILLNKIVNRTDVENVLFVWPQMAPLVAPLKILPRPLTSVADPGFPRRGRQSNQRGYLAFFPENAWDWKFWTRGRRVPNIPMDPSMNADPGILWPCPWIRDSEGPRNLESINFCREGGVRPLGPL